MAQIDNTNPVRRRIVVEAECVLKMPALLGSGEDEISDNDVLRDRNKAPFLTGSSLGGTLRSLLPETDGLTLFGGLNDGMSPLYVLDSMLWMPDLKTPAQIIQLDGVALDRDNKVAKNSFKYDFEAVQRGSVFRARLMLIERENDPKGCLEGLLNKVMSSLLSGNVSVGAKTRRGFGRVDCKAMRKLEFVLTKGSIEALNKWKAFDWFNESCWKKATPVKLKGADPLPDGSNTESAADKPKIEYIDPSPNGMSEIRAKLKLNGSIMIRDVRGINEDAGDEIPDYRHISNGENAVIYGTSWAGAVLSGLHRLLKPRMQGNEDKFLGDYFGFAEKDENQASKMIFDASILSEEDKRTDGYRFMTRVKVDRFTSGAADGALFSETPWYGGKTELVVRCPKKDKAAQELVLLALEGLNRGLISIGGESAIGRGFFEVKEVTVNGVNASLNDKKPNLAKAIYLFMIKNAVNGENESPGEILKQGGDPA
ncbi:MAG: hypothetical protein LBT59_08430 [Clostridiales bacterium]|nr:hypothetical protein [Clostridiales bacterium]